jgi:Flp pilus assembly protein TadB
VQRRRKKQTNTKLERKPLGKKAHVSLSVSLVCKKAKQGTEEQKKRNRKAKRREEEKQKKAKATPRHHHPHASAWPFPPCRPDSSSRIAGTKSCLFSFIVKPSLLLSIFLILFIFFFLVLLIFFLLVLLIILDYVFFIENLVSPLSASLVSMLARVATSLFLKAGLCIKDG